MSNPEGGCGESIGDTRVEVIPENNNTSSTPLPRTENQPTRNCCKKDFKLSHFSRDDDFLHTFAIKTDFNFVKNNNFELEILPGSLVLR